VRSRPLLVLAAWPPELAKLRRRLAGGRALDRRAELRTIGVGLVAAAVGAARAIAEVRPSAVVLVGTAGAYADAPGAPRVGNVAAVERALLVSAAAVTARGYFPAPARTELALDARLCAELRDATDARPAIVGCPLAITSDAALARRIARGTGATLENLEAFAAAEAAANADVPFAAVLGVANVVGPAAHAQWRLNAKAAAAAACDVVWAWLPRAVRAPSRRARSPG
jgi:purine-nucleoside phosphorylase